MCEQQRRRSACASAISAFVVHCSSFFFFFVLFFSNLHADLNHRWPYMSVFSDVAMHILISTMMLSNGCFHIDPVSSTGLRIAVIAGDTVIRRPIRLAEDL